MVRARRVSVSPCRMRAGRCSGTPREATQTLWVCADSLSKLLSLCLPFRRVCRQVIVRELPEGLRGPRLTPLERGQKREGPQRRDFLILHSRQTESFSAMAVCWVE